MKFTKLTGMNAQGISHILAPLVLVLSVGVISTFALVSSKADLSNATASGVATKKINLTVTTRSNNRYLSCETWMYVEFQDANFKQVGKDSKNHATGCKYVKSSKDFVGTYRFSSYVAKSLKANQYKLSSQNLMHFPNPSDAKRQGYNTSVDQGDTCTSDVTTPLFLKFHASMKLTVKISGNTSTESQC